MNAAHARGETFRIGVWTGASTAPELDGALAKVDGMEMRLPYQSDPTRRRRINAGEMEYIDIHLSHVAQFVWGGFLGNLDVAIVEVAGIREDGMLIPSSSIGNNKTWLDRADRIILEVNSWQNARSKVCTTSITAPSCRRIASRSRSSASPIALANPFFVVTRKKLSPLSRPTSRTAIPPSRRRSENPVSSPSIFSNSSPMK